MENGKSKMEIEYVFFTKMGNRKWEFQIGEILVKAEFNFFSGYYHFFFETLCTKIKGIY